MKAVVVPGLLAGLAGVALGALAQQAPPSSAFAAPNLSPAGVRSLAATCAPCHGPGGHPATGATLPGLAGRPAADIAGLMAAYRAGTRPGTLMGQIARGFTEPEVQAIAGYFAAARD